MLYSIDFARTENLEICLYLVKHRMRDKGSIHIYTNSDIILFVGK